MPPTTCIAMKDLKNTAVFTKTVQSAPGPVVVTKNGIEAFVSMSMDCYESLVEEAARAKLYLNIERAESDVRSGRLHEGHDLVKQLRDSYGL